MGYTRSKTVIFYQKIMLIAFSLGLPNFGYENIDCSRTVKKLHNTIYYFFYCTDATLVVSQVIAFWTQHNLNYQQKFSLMNLASVTAILLVSTITLTTSKEEVRQLVRDLTTKQYIPFDESIGVQMIRKVKQHALAVSSGVFSAWLFHGVDGLFSVIKYGNPFVTMVTAWPLTDDLSVSGAIGRVLVYVGAFSFFSRTCATLSVAIAMGITTRFQYVQLNKYFCSLSKIYEESLSQDEKDKKYEKAMKTGIMQHKKILDLTKRVIKVCTYTYGGQILTNMVILITGLFMLLHNDDLSLTFIIKCVATIIAGSITSGFYLWTAGDITAEASNLATAVYMSGWENCGRKSSIRIRKLISITMSLTQKPLTIKTLYLVPLSHATHLRLIKTSYSIFSVLY